MFLRRAAVRFPRRCFTSKSGGNLASSIDELNKEMESIFGGPPSDGFLGSASKNDADHEFQLTYDKFTGPRGSSEPHLFRFQKVDENAPRLTHVSTEGDAQMVDVSSKEDTKRVAVASCKVILGKTVFDLVLANQMAKGDVLSVAKLAGITGAKHTSSLIPLCHNVALTHINVDLRLNPKDLSVDIEGEAICTGKTGVEMEAMTAVTVAGLTVYDMCKAASKHIKITDVRLERKTGGKSGCWSRED